MDQALVAEMEEVVERPRGPAKIRYTHADMIDYIIANPWVSQGELALRYGYTQGWVSTVMASDAFQSALAKRREEVVNPAMVATLEERFRALTLQSLERLTNELEKPGCKPEIALRAAELGAKSLGVGGHAPPPAPAADSLARLADRLITLNQAHNPQIPREILDGEAERVQ